MTEPKPMDFEVLPPKKTRDTPDLSRLLAWLLDDLIPIPGTKMRVGLDPIIGLIPGLGDSSTAALSTMLLINGLRAGVPRIVLARMAVNVLVNAILGAVPLLGDVFSAFFKSNRRNYELLQRHTGKGPARTSTTGDWVVVGGLIGLVFLIAVTASIGVAYLAVQFFKLLIAA